MTNSRIGTAMVLAFFGCQTPTPALRRAGEVVPEEAETQCDVDETASESRDEVSTLPLDDLARILNVPNLSELLSPTPPPQPAGESEPAPIDDPEGYFGTSEDEEPPIPYYDGTPAPQDYYMARLAFIKVCDTDGKTNCGVVVPSAVQGVIDDANAIHYRSGSRIRFTNETRFSAVVYSDALNNNCKPVEGFAEKDEGADPAELCPKVWDKNVGETIGKSLEQHGRIAVFVRGGLGSVEWDEALGQWTAKRPEHSFSGCDDHGVYLLAISSGADLAHEVGHYFCLPHTHKSDRPENLAEAVVRIQVAAENSANPVAQKPIILMKAFDGDHYVYKTGDYAYLNDHQVADTAPDPGKPLWVSEFTDHCDLSASQLSVTATVGLPEIDVTFTLAPVRTNPESYFKNCFPGYQHFSTNQVTRAHAAAGGHRSVVAPLVSVDSWQNNLDVAIPPLQPYSPLNYATSTIATSAAGPIKRAKVHVSITHDNGAMAIELVKSDGMTVPLKYGIVADKTPTGNLRTIFYVDGAGLPATGTWTLRVADITAATGATRRLDGWRIELE